MEAGEATEPCSAVPYHAVFSPQSRFTLAYPILPSGKHTKNYGKIPIFHEKIIENPLLRLGHVQ